MMEPKVKEIEIRSSKGVTLTINTVDHCPSSLGLIDADEEDALCCDECYKCWTIALEKVEDFDLIWQHEGKWSLSL